MVDGNKGAVTLTLKHQGGVLLGHVHVEQHSVPEVKGAGAPSLDDPAAGPSPTPCMQGSQLLYFNNRGATVNLPACCMRQSMQPIHLSHSQGLLLVLGLILWRRLVVHVQIHTDGFALVSAG